MPDEDGPGTGVVRSTEPVHPDVTADAAASEPRSDAAVAWPRG